MVDHPDPDPPSTDAYDQGSDGMPERTRRAFQAHYETQLEPSEQIEQAIAEIEQVFDRGPDSAVAVSGGKDSLTVLRLAAMSDATHRAFHWDWGARLIPRELEREVVGCIRAHVPDDRLFVAARAETAVQPYADHDAFQRQLHEHDGIMDTDGSLDRLAGVLSRTDEVSRQLVGLRKAESGGRDRQVDGLWGESLGQPAAFPIRDWTARDVWAFIISSDMQYPSYYDAVAHATGDGSPRDYEQARLATVHDPEFDNHSVDGLAAWRHHDHKQR